MPFSKIMLICACCLYALSSQAQYVRKQLKPAFFIPEQELSYQEKLPPIPMVQPQTSLETVKKVSAPSDEPSATNTPSPSKKKSTITVNKPILDEEIHPDYKEKYDDYLNDLKIIEETGKIPANKSLEQDLKKMNSNIPFEVK